VRSSTTEEGSLADVLEESNAQNRVITIKTNNSLFSVAEKKKIYVRQKRGS
jgi:hypothetical protein